LRLVIILFYYNSYSALPFYSKHLNAKLREPDEVAINNIKSRNKSDLIKTEVQKEQLMIENKLKRNYTKDEEHEKIKSEIEKTLNELYGDESSNYSNTYSSSYNRK
jgi:hypothetical protein